MKVEWDKGVLFTRGTFMFLSVGLVLVNHLVPTDHVYRSSWRWSYLLSFCLGRDSDCNNVFSKISLLDKIFKILWRD